MSYFVEWKNTALDMLADQWNNSSDPNAVTAAADDADAQLRRDPFAVGESRAGNDRLAFFGPIGLNYRINPVSRMVTVLSVGPANPPSYPATSTARPVFALS